MISDDDDDLPGPRQQKHPPVNREIGRARQLFDQSVKDDNPNFGFVALAIGQWAYHKGFPRTKSPQWAIDACRDLYEKAEVANGPVIGLLPGPASAPADEIKLELVADIFADMALRLEHGFSRKEPSARAVIRHVLGKPKKGDDDGDVQRLQRLWRHDQVHRRRRAFSRLHKKYDALGLLHKIKRDM